MPIVPNAQILNIEPDKNLVLGKMLALVHANSNRLNPLGYKVHELDDENGNTTQHYVIITWKEGSSLNDNQAMFFTIQSSVDIRNLRPYNAQSRLFKQWAIGNLIIK